jgi:putative transposase
VGHPRFRSRKDNRASIRLTRNGFGPATGGVQVAKVGDVRLVWSRVLPCVPSSVTVIRDADGWYYPSFVVEVADTPLPRSTNDVGIDLGLASLAVLSTGEVVANPRYLMDRKGRALARAQKSLARKTKGSKRRARAVRRVAVQHRRVRDTRLDAHHKLAHCHRWR